MFKSEAQADGLGSLLFAEELEERLEMCLCIKWDCNDKGPFDGCWYCVGYGCDGEQLPF